MRILHVIRWLDFADGGPPVVVTRAAAAQAELGHQVTIACYSCGADEETENQLSTLSNWDKVQLQRFPQPDRLERLWGMDAARRLRPLIAESDVVHIHNVWETILLRAAAAAKAAGKPYLVMLNGMLDPWSLAQREWKKKFAMAIAHRRMLNSSASLHVNSESERDLIAPLHLTAPATVIPNGVALEEIGSLPAHGEFAASHPKLAGRRFILFLGRLHFKKGLDYLADSFARLARNMPDLDLVVAGKDDGEQQHFQDRVAALGLSPRVHIVGPLYGREKFAALADCECFVLPSRQEGFSLAILEAMAAGAAVVISEQCHFPEIAAAGAGEVVPLDADAVAGATQRVLENPNRRRMGQIGREMVLRHFTWKRVAEQMVSVYGSLQTSDVHLRRAA